MPALEIAGVDGGEIDDRVGDAVGVVRQNVQRHVLDDLDDLRVVKSSASGVLEVAVGDVAALEHYGAGEPERGVGLRIGGRHATGGKDFFGGETRVTAEQG